MVANGRVICGVERGRNAGQEGFRLPFGYYVQTDADLLILRSSDGSFVAAFGAGDADLFEVEAAVWEDAD